MCMHLDLTFVLMTAISKFFFYLPSPNISSNPTEYHTVRKPRHEKIFANFTTNLHVAANFSPVLKIAYGYGDLCHCIGENFIS